MAEAEKVKKLLKNAELCFITNELKKGGEKLQQAIKLAKVLRDEALISQGNEIFRKFFCSTEVRTIRLDPIKVDGFILDIGGGGEGTIGRLNGKQVIAIDTNEKELRETRNASLKLVMDATKLKFLPRSFDACTAFFSLMYVPKEKHQTVFEEVHRVLKQNGKFLLWDVEIPEKLKHYKGFIARLKIKLPSGEIETGYGVKSQQQDLEHFKSLAKETGFKILKARKKFEIIYLEMLKRA
jgi:ubiquinone/menaquinone biosynthesis C-methylase UbiE